MSEFYVGQWVRRKRDDKIGYIDDFASFRRNSVFVVFNGQNYRTSVFTYEIEPYEETLESVKQDLINDALDNNSKEWFDYAVNIKAIADLKSK